jgi:hypothetical protein
MYVADDFWQTNPQGELLEQKHSISPILKPSKDTDMADQYSVRLLWQGSLR